VGFVILYKFVDSFQVIQILTKNCPDIHNFFHCIIQHIGCTCRHPEVVSGDTWGFWHRPRIAVGADSAQWSRTESCCHGYRVDGGRWVYQHEPGSHSFGHGSQSSV